MRAHGRITASSFEPHPLLRNRHVQTLLTLTRRSQPRWRVETFETHDGDWVRVGWLDADAADAPVAILVHGLAGGLDSPYAGAMAVQLAQRGWRVALLELRGAGTQPNRLARGYHHGDTEDLRALCTLLRTKHPGLRIALIGWSLGACIVLKAMGQEGEAAPVDAAVGISVPFDLQHNAQTLRETARFYQYMMMRALKSRVRRKHARVLTPTGVDLTAIASAQDFMEFGDRYIAPCNGFRDARDYCERASCKPELRQIRRPTLIIQSLDDPVLGSGGLPSDSELPADATMEVAQAGGHAGFVASGPYGMPQWWLETRVPEFLAQALRMASHEPNRRA
jgi:uncharacterized protein